MERVLHTPHIYTNASEIVPTNPDLSTLALGGFDDAALNIASYLSARSILTLHQVNQGLNSLLNKHDEVLFEQLIHQDFIEGYVLNYVAKRDNLSYKKLYLAFYNRWSLPKFGSEKNTKPKKRNKLPELSITWQRDCIIRDDIDENSMLFIARLGSYDGDNALYDRNYHDDIDRSCILLQWNKNWKDASHRLNNEGGSDDDRYQLVIDKGWKDNTDGFYMNQNSNANMEFLENEDIEEFEAALRITHTLTLHAIDISQYRVATLMEENKFDYLEESEELERTLTMANMVVDCPVYVVFVKRIRPSIIPGEII